MPFSPSLATSAFSISRRTSPLSLWSFSRRSLMILLASGFRHGLLRDADALLWLHVVERPHIVQPVGELHQQHPHILGHGQQQLAEVFRLRCLLGYQVELVDLG
jgi:hypothetical protein